MSFDYDWQIMKTEGLDWQLKPLPSSPQNFCRQKGAWLLFWDKEPPLPPPPTSPPPLWQVFNTSFFVEGALGIMCLTGLPPLPFSLFAALWLGGGRLCD